MYNGDAHYSCVHVVDMSFGFSVGDLIKAVELAKDIRTRLIDAPKQFSAISDESVETIFHGRSLELIFRVKN